MSAEHRDRNPSQIKTTITESLGRVSEQSSRVQEAITQALKNGPIDLQALIAALELSGQLNLTMESFLKNQGEVVFPEGQSVQSPVVDGEEDKSKPIATEGPKTFGELLRAKIDSELLPVDKGSFAKSEIFQVARDTSGVRRAALAEGISANKSKLTREQVTNILYRFFTTPQARFKKKAGGLQFAGI